MEHGTEEMYRKELRKHKKGEGFEPCAPCRQAHSRYMDAYRQSKPPRDRSAETRAATVRRRALNRLAAEYPEEFQRLLAAEQEYSDAYAD